LRRVAVDEVRIDKAKGALRQRLDSDLKIQGSMIDNATVVSELAFTWLENRLPETLRWDEPASVEVVDRAVKAVEPVMVEYKAGIAELAAGGRPLTEQDRNLLYEEYNAWIKQLGWRERLARSLAVFGMYLAVAVLCGFYIYHRRPRLLSDLRSFVTLLATLV